ncbi:MAG: NAD(P)/FAD-dependent oxidoreductase [Mediterranea massiliensis]|nr:NAD(P)/FAD-dependent oxidoreductase [Mediterranea massiliensis]
MKQKVIIIGSGLGGLECGYILAKEGMDVTILEQDAHIGGCLQTFKRGACLFDTGFHYIGGLREGESLHPLFRYFGLLNLPWKQLDEDCFDEVIIGNRSFVFANGHEQFVERLCEDFPAERDNLKRYVSFLQSVGSHIYDSFSNQNTDNFYSSSLFARSAYEFLEETIKDPLLRKVLSGTSLKMELAADSLPLYTFAQINNSYLQSAWRLKGGGSQIADKLAEEISLMGGNIRKNALVTQLMEEGGKIVQVEINGEEIMEADWVISGIHPASTLALITECKNLRRIYRSRINGLKNTFGFFTANIKLKPNVFPYLNRNLYIHQSEADLWNINTTNTESVLVSCMVPSDESGCTPNIDLLTPMKWEEVNNWANKTVGNRGEDYVTFKESKTESCLKLIEKRLPELRNAIDHIYTSTPLSYHHYLKMREGTAYGIRKDYNNTMGTVLTPRTPLSNLLLTGQNLNLHGVLGVSMTSIFTCAEIIGMEYLRNQILKT